MPQKVLKFTGINRKVNEFQNSGACEELINLRPKPNGGCEIVRNKVSVRSNTQYDALIQHSFGEESHFVASSNGTVVWVNPDDGSESVITSEFAGRDVTFSYAGNVLVIYCESEKKQSVFKFKDGAYESFSINLRRITNAYISYGSSYFAAPANTVESVDGTAASLNEAMHKAASGFYGKYTNGLCGASVVGCTYELEDGSEVWSTAFAVANSAKAYQNTAPVVDGINDNVTVTGAVDVKLNLLFGSGTNKGVKRINIYSSRPVYPYEIVSKTTPEDIEVRELSLDDVNLAGQQMYYQGSATLEDNHIIFSLRFGDAIDGNKLMDVTSGCIDRVGNAVSYNNRFHYFRSETNHYIQPPTITRAPNQAFDGASTSDWIAYVLFDGKWKMIDNYYSLLDGSAVDIIYPMAGVESVAFVKASSKASVPYNDVFFVNLKESTAYNYSYAFDVIPEIVPVADNWYDELQESGQLWGKPVDSTILWKKEINAINVSAPYNPFVFPVNYSYSFGGEIKDIATSYLPISSTQVGQYPITVFTTNGIYALEQGSGAVLYGNIVPLQPHVIEGKAKATPYGTFFISSKNLYILAGRDATNVSMVLDGELEMTLKANDDYKKLCCSEKAPLHDFTNALSTMRFKSFIQGASLLYDQFNNELIIVNNTIDAGYSYVFNIDTKTYHKISKKYVGTANESRYTLMKVGNYTNVIDMQTEEDEDDVQDILLLSRPFALDVLYSHIDRLIAMIDAKIDGYQYLCLSVFASDNLNNWKCIISAQKHDTIFRQIRTNRAAKSYKDYMILINGTVSADTDLSEIIADYTVVSRRLG